MREWMREKMRRRSKRGPNESESTGKIGQELPANQPAPLKPNYPEAPTSDAQASGGQASDAQASDARTTDAQASDARTSAKASDARPSGERAAHVHPPEVEPLSAPISLPWSEGHSNASADGDSGEAASRPESRRSRGGRGRRSGGRSGAGRDQVTGDSAAPESAPIAEASAEPAEPAGKLVVEHQPDSVGVPPAEHEAVPQRSPRGYVVLTIGLPGSGKTTWFKRRGVTPLSSDMLRSILFDDITEQRYQGLVFSTLRSLLRARLIAKMPWNYVDATNLSPHERRQWIKMAKSFGYDVQAVFFDVPLEVCLERNRRRERIVAEDVMHKMAERLKAPEFKEGFSKITLVRVKNVAKDDLVEAAEPAFHAQV